MGFKTTIEEVCGKKFYKSIDEDGGMNGTSYAPVFRTSVVNIQHRNEVERKEYRDWVERVQEAGLWKGSQYEEALKVSEHPFAINFFLGKAPRVFTNTLEEAVRVCEEKAITGKSIGPFGNK